MKKMFDEADQVLLPLLTIGGYILISMKLPSWGLLVNLVAQIFWIYSGYIAWKKGGQIGILVTSLILTVILAYGVLNYWVIH